MIHCFFVVILVACFYFFIIQRSCAEVSTSLALATVSGIIKMVHAVSDTYCLSKRQSRIVAK